MTNLIADFCNVLPGRMAVYFMGFMPESVARRAYEKLWESCAKSDSFTTVEAPDGAIWLKAVDDGRLWKDGPVSLELPAKLDTRQTV